MFRSQVRTSNPKVCIRFRLTHIPGPNELLLKLNCTGLCMSDVHYMLNDLPLPKQMQDYGVYSPGHEGAGVVVKVGSNVTGWKVGDRGGVKPM
jgi:alcohol dehydrogenase, propanol-preferring